MPKYINADQFERDCMFDRECEDMQDVIYKLRDYPSADVVEVKHGKWVKTYEYGNDDPVQCSACLMEFDYIDGIGYLTDRELPNFCPNCGADMRERREAEK